MAQASMGPQPPKERVNIVYRPAASQAGEEIELPLKLLMIGDYQGSPDERPVEERDVISINKENFNDVLARYALTLSLRVDDVDITLPIRTMKDFEPDSIVRNVSPLRELLALRTALSALKGPLGNRPGFRKKVQDILENVQTRRQLAAELNPHHNPHSNHE